MADGHNGGTFDMDSRTMTKAQGRVGAVGGDLPSYASRRVFLSDTYQPLLDSLVSGPAATELVLERADAFPGRNPLHPDDRVRLAACREPLLALPWQ